MKNSSKEILESYIDALYPIIYVNHFDFRTIDGVIGEISKGKYHVVEYQNGLGIVRFEGKALIKECDLVDFLKYVKDDGYDDPVLIVLKDVHNQLDDPQVSSLIKYICERNLYEETYSATVFILSSILKIPRELEDYITIFDIPLPTIGEINDIITAFTEDLRIEISGDAKGELAQSFKGLNEYQILQILNLAFQDGGTIDAQDKHLILRQKEQFIKKSGLLEMVPVKESVDDIGGLQNLKEWLYQKERIFSQLDKAIRFGVDVPKGIMIVGMPGCGKSLTAKATAQLFKIPLVRLDVGRLLGKYVGESEENMRRALQLSEAISPCVLWIDEIEKAFSGVGDSGGSDTTTRLFGQFLTWMQEKENTVFIVATANDISKIPPEFLRKGRFDELFSVGLPSDDERKQIIKIHLKKRGKWNESLDIGDLVKATKDYNGADLEAIVKDAVEGCFIAGQKDLTKEDLLESKKRVKSISETLKTRIEQIQKAVDSFNITSASPEPEESMEKKDPKKASVEKGRSESPISNEPATSVSELLGKKWWKN